MGVGFIHGVMNTDNMTISGETIDYGPCAFMDEFDFRTVFSSIDHSGSYAFGNQDSVAQWNIAQFSQALHPLFAKNEKASQQLQEILHSFADRFYFYWHKKMRDKLGLVAENTQTAELTQRFFTLLQQHQPDYTNTLRLMSSALDSEQENNHLITAMGEQPSSKQWVFDWLACIQQQNSDMTQLKTKMNQVNPAYIPRNHLVENAINQFVDNKDRTLLDALLAVLKKPYPQQKDTDHLQSIPLPHERVYQTFCGT